MTVPTPHDDAALDRASRYRFHGRTPPKREQRTPLLAEAPPGASSNGVATLRLYDPIDSWGGYWGVSAKEFIAALEDLDDDVTEIRLHINSPGGEVFEGIAILNALRNHKARVVTVVDGLAASAASFVAMAGDEVVMGRNTELMIHDASGICIGNAEDMRWLAGRLDKISDNIASVYAEKAGGTVEDWRAAMLAETWYSAQEAVDAGLADRVEAAQDAGDAEKVENHFDLSLFNYAGRSKAPAPPIPSQPTATGRASSRSGAPQFPAASADGSTTTQEGSLAVDFTPEQATNMRQQLGLAEDADQATILAALGEALAERAEPAAAIPPGTVIVEEGVLNDLRAAASQGREAREQQLLEQRERLVNEAVRDGRVAPARRQHWLDQLEADPGAAETLANLAKGLIPVEERGHANASGPDVNKDDETYQALFGAPKEA